MVTLASLRRIGTPRSSRIRAPPTQQPRVELQTLGPRGAQVELQAQVLAAGHKAGDPARVDEARIARHGEHALARHLQAHLVEVLALLVPDEDEVAARQAGHGPHFPDVDRALADAALGEVLAQHRAELGVPQRAEHELRPRVAGPLDELGQ
jgi:hypothetical protein